MRGQGINPNISISGRTIILHGIQIASRRIIGIWLVQSGISFKQTIICIECKKLFVRHLIPVIQIKIITCGHLMLILCFRIEMVKQILFRIGIINIIIRQYLTGTKYKIPVSLYAYGMILRKASHSVCVHFHKKGRHDQSYDYSFHTDSNDYSYN